jgi:MFS transporter, ACS family, tartrate transporter
MQLEESSLESRTLRKVAWRLIPFLFVLYVCNILDRNNISIAQLTMKKDLAFSDGMLGFASGIFFLGYFFFQVPSNLMLERLGARRWIAWIIMGWGAVACCLALVSNAASLYSVRFLLGVAQAGFFPGMVLYLTYWFPDVLRGRAAARFILANVVAGIIGNPLGAALLKLDGYLGLQGWQWLFLLEGIPTILIGLSVFFYMTSRPEDARWLSDEERGWLIRRLSTEREHREKHHPLTLAQAFRYPRVLHLAALFFLNMLAASGLGFFTNPLLKERLQMDDTSTLLIATLPAIVGALSLLLFSSLSDRTGERRLFVVAGLLMCAVGVTIVALTRSPWVTLGALCLISFGGQCTNGPFWALTSGFLTGAAAAGGLAFINSIGNSGSFFGPWMMGQFKDLTGDHQMGLFVTCGVWLCTVVVAFLLPEDPAQRALREAAAKQA